MIRLELKGLSIENHYENIEEIIAKGHEVANGGITENSNLLDLSEEEIIKEILEVDKLLYNKGVNTFAYMHGQGFVDNEILIAMSAINKIEGYEEYELFISSKSPFNSKFKGYLAKDIVKEYFNINSYMALSRGEIVYFNLGANIYIEEKEIVETIKLIKENYIDNSYCHRYNGEEYILESINLGYKVVPISI